MCAKVLYVATSRNTMGGISSVLKKYENMLIWDKYSCTWLETQSNKSMLHKLWYLVKSYFLMLFQVPKNDIIHFHTVPGISLVIQLPIFLFSIICGKHIVVHIHVGNQLLDYSNDKLFLFVLKNATRVVVLANALKEIMKDIYDVDSSVLYNPIEIPICRDENNIEKNIFFAAYLTKNKGYDTLLKAFKIISEKYSDWKLIIAGTGELDIVKRMLIELEITENVEIYPWLNKEQMNYMYQKASIYCIASYKEGFPMSFIEAASYGVPIVTTPVGGLVDVIEDGVNCLTFDFGNEKELARQLETLIVDKNLRYKMSENIRNLAITEFSLESINKRIDELYQSIIL